MFRNNFIKMHFHNKGLVVRKKKIQSSISSDKTIICMSEWTVGPCHAASCSHVVESWLLQQQQRCQLTAVDTNNRARRCCGRQTARGTQTPSRCPDTCGYSHYMNRFWLERVSGFRDEERPESCGLKRVSIDPCLGADWVGIAHR